MKISKFLALFLLFSVFFLCLAYRTYISYLFSYCRSSLFRFYLYIRSIQAVAVAYSKLGASFARSSRTLSQYAILNIHCSIEPDVGSWFRGVNIVLGVMHIACSLLILLTYFIRKRPYMPDFV